MNYVPPPQLPLASDMYGGVNWAVNSGGTGNSMKLGPFSPISSHPPHHPHGMYGQIPHHSSPFSGGPSPAEHNNRQVILAKYLN